MFRRFTAILLTLLMLAVLLPTAAVTPAAAVAETREVETYAQETVQGSAILHCFNWSYNEIKAALPDIAAAGYTAVQTSPAQQPKDYNAAWTDSSGQWWKLYQPLGLRVAPDGTSWLGTKAELKALCDEAERYNIKVIVDVVANHLANDGQDGGTFERLSPDVDAELQDAAYYHTYTSFINDSSRLTMTQYHMNMPDLNTGSAFIQQKTLAYLKELVDCGVDGFRFDAAKHIELPTDDASFASDFWPYVLNGVSDYASGDLFFYGEILGGAGTAITNYTQYMAVTDNETGNSARVNAVNKNARGLANYVYYKNDAPKNCVLWAESHDTYNDGGSTSVSDADIIKTWAIVGSRADSTALFFARPNETMGLASSDTTWKATAVAEVNKFKTHFDGTTEYVAAEGSVAYVERGTNGVVIVNLGSGTAVSVPAHKMRNGTYVDQITGNTFTVANGTISGTVGSTGVAVVYNADEAANDFISATTLYLKPNANWASQNARFAMYVFNLDGGTQWVSMEALDDGYYKADVPAGDWTNVIFCRMDPATTANNWDNKWNQTANLFPDFGADCYTVKEGTWDEGGGDWSIYGYVPVEQGGYYLIGSMTGWSVNSGYKMEKNEFAGTDEYMIETDLTVSSQFKVIYSPDGVSKPDDNYFPQGMGNNYGENGEITEDGTYKVYFRPNYDGDSSWFYNCIYAEKTGGQTNPAAGYYVIGNMTNWNVNSAYKMTKNTAASTEEYTFPITLTTSSQFKVVYSPDGTTKGTWYPDGMGNNYGEHGEITEAGDYTVYFRPRKDGGSGWFNGYIYLEKYVAPPAHPDGYYLVAPGASIDDVDPAYMLEPAGTDGHVFNDDLTYVLTGNFGAATWNVVKIESDAIVPYATNQPVTVTTTGVTETVYLEMANPTFPEESGCGVTSITGYFLNIGNMRITEVTADYGFTETEDAGIWKLDQSLYATDVFVFRAENGRYVERFPHLNYDDPEKAYYLPDARYGWGERTARIYFRPDGLGDEEAGWYKGFFTDRILSAVTIADAAHGSVSADRTAAVEDGLTVTLTVAPEAGYELDTITATYTDLYYESHAFVPTPNPDDETKYTFVMPIYDVTITATFKELPKPVYTVTLEPGFEGVDPVIITSDDEGVWAADWRSAQNGQFYPDGDKDGFRVPDLPNAFLRTGWRFLGWYDTVNTFSPGTFLNAGSYTLIAQWEKPPVITYMPIDETVAFWHENNPTVTEAGEDVEVMICFADGAYEAGWRLEKLIVTDAEGETEIMEDVDGIYLADGTERFDAMGRHLYLIRFNAGSPDVTVDTVWIPPEPPAPTLTGIEIAAQPTKTQYNIGEALSVAGGKVKLLYSDGTSKVIDMTEAMVSGFDSSKAGTCKLTVTYEGKTATFTVTIIDPVKTFDGTVKFNEGEVEYKGATAYVIWNYGTHKPAFTVYDAKGAVISAANYTYTYKENSRPGTGYLFITFKNEYRGEARLSFKIYLPSTTETTVENVKDGIRVTWKAVKGAAGYVIYRRAWSSTTNGWTAFARWDNTTATTYLDGHDASHKVFAGTRYQYGVKAYFARRTDPVSGEQIGGNVNEPSGNFNLGMVGPLKTTVRITTRVLNSVTAGKKQMTVKWAGSSVFTGYQIQYAENAAFTKNAKAIKISNPKTVQTVLKNLKSGTTYYVRIRSYHEFNGMTYFGEWSNVKSTKVK